MDHKRFTVRKKSGFCLQIMLKKKAIALFSGGLDSLLAIQLMLEQNIEVIALHIDIGFHSIEDKTIHLKQLAEGVGAEFLLYDTRSQFVEEILFTPKYGYGKNMNPCIDCHGNMFAIARELMKEKEADFLVSGEVIGQRPMSQHKKALRSVIKLSGTDGLLLRPLSAKLLPETIPEREGWVDRSMLEGISGRGRKRQLELAQKFGLKDYDPPGGGCLLTNPTFSTRLREAATFGEGKFSSKDIEPLKLGRHFRLPDGSKFILARDDGENEKILQKSYEGYELLMAGEEVIGPIGMISIDASQNDRQLAARILLAYSRTSREEQKSVQVGKSEVKVVPFTSREESRQWLVQP